MWVLFLMIGRHQAHLCSGDIEASPAAEDPVRGNPITSAIRWRVCSPRVGTILPSGVIGHRDVGLFWCWASLVSEKSDDRGSERARSRRHYGLRVGASEAAGSWSGPRGLRRNWPSPVARLKGSSTGGISAFVEVTPTGPRRDDLVELGLIPPSYTPRLRPGQLFD